MKPAVGRTVIYREPVHPALPEHLKGGTNGTLEHPAIITRVWSDTCVNLHVFFDANPSEPRTSMLLLFDPPEGAADTSGNCGWRWPVIPNSNL